MSSNRAWYAQIYKVLRNCCGGKHLVSLLYWWKLDTEQWWLPQLVIRTSVITVIVIIFVENESKSDSEDHARQIARLEDEARDLKKELDLKKKFSDVVIAERDSFKNLVDKLERA